MQTTTDQSTTGDTMEFSKLIEFLTSYIRGLSPNMRDDAARALRIGYTAVLRAMPIHIAKLAVSRTVAGHTHGVPKPADLNKQVADELAAYHASLRPALTHMHTHDDGGIPGKTRRQSQDMAWQLIADPNTDAREINYLKRSQLVCFGYLVRTDTGFAAGPKLE